MTWDDLTAEERMTWDLGLGVRALGYDADDAVAVSRHHRSDKRRRVMPNHPLCFQCFRRMVDSNRGTK